ncbi:Myb/SANT-like domain-containing protein [Quillaja saponaria]|uniref:Myb/SANT-like domain-containing protein n=1 Tax=Quillaja saponaria TaxID=32244 RepID=A0AAD7M729_QUISA|nr:Myb/SANT-like domain-containing protein [Quillaja saponaria]
MEKDDGDEVSSYRGKKSYLRWTESMDRLLLEVLKEQKIKGQKDDRNFSQEAYRAAVQAVNTEFKMDIDAKKVVNRLKTLKTQMGVAVDTLNKSGFSWNDITKRIEAEPQVWDGIEKVNDDVKLIRSRELRNLELMRDIFEKDRATGLGATSAKERVKRWEKETMEMSIEDIDQMQTSNEVHLEGIDIFDNFAPSSTGYHAPTSSTQSMSKSSSKRGIKRKAAVIDLINEGITEVKDAMKDIALAISNTSRRVRSEDEVVQELMKMGFCGNLFLDALDYLVEDPVRINTFFACPEHLRPDWLCRKLGSA